MDAALPTPPLEPVGGRAAWAAATLDPSWCRAFTDEEVDGLAGALATFERSNPTLDPSTMTAEDFPLSPVWRAEIVRLRRELVDGPGVVAYEGFHVERYETEQLRALWWGLARSIGTPVPQSYRNDYLGDVKDLGSGIAGRTGRGYTSNAALNFYADAADVSGLFFLRTAWHGGVTRVASSVTVHDVIARRRPDLLAELYRPLPWSWQGNQPPGAPAWYEMPVFGRIGAETACAYVRTRTNILLARDNAGAPELSERQREAVQLAADVAAEPGHWVERSFAPGAMLFVNHHTVLHLRTAFVDWAEPERKRHLLRVWLSPPNNRALPDSFAPFFRHVAAATVRGGYPGAVGAPTYRTA